MSQDAPETNEILEEELLFLDIPELSRFEIFDGMNATMENIVFDESNETMNFELNIASEKDLEDPIKLKFQGENVQTMGTCMFFSQINKIEINEDFKMKDYSEIYINQSNVNSKKNQFEVEYTGKCNKVIQAFIIDQ